MTRLIATALLFTFLAACQSGPELTRIGDLQPSPKPAISPAVSFDINREQVIDSYRALLELGDYGAIDGGPLQRLADLELESGMDKRISDDSRTAEHGVSETRQAINRYRAYLDAYPGRTQNDAVLYQLSRAYAVEGDLDQSIHFMERLIAEYPDSRYSDEVQFRRGESLFVERRYAEAEQAYRVVVERYPDSILHQKALYKLGWSRFKQNRLESANQSFVALLDFYHGEGMIEREALPGNLDRANRELIEDVLRVVSLTFSYDQDNQGDQALARFFDRHGHRVYEPLLYRELAELHQSKQRGIDAADTLLAFGTQYPISDLTPIFHDQAIDLYRNAGFSDLELNGKQDFIKQYNVGTTFWQQQDPTSRERLQPILTRHLFDTSTHYHALARSSNKQRDYRRAAEQYRLYLDSFPSDERAAEINFLLAEASSDAGLYREAVSEYEKTAYRYPLHDYSAEAGYAALTTYGVLKQKASKSDRPRIDGELIQSSLRFAARFPADPRVNDVLLNTAELHYALNNFKDTDEIAQRMIDRPSISPAQRHRSWVIAAYSRFELQQYARAEAAYLQAIKGLQPNQRNDRQQMREQLAASIYLQGDQARSQGKHRVAAGHFERVRQVVPTSEKRIVAQYDAATEYIKIEAWQKSIDLLEDFRRRYPKNKKWRQGVSEKLALAYSQAGNRGKAATELMLLASISSAVDQRDLLWQAATLYQEDGQAGKAIEIYKSYVRKYPRPVARSIELQQRIADSYQANAEIKKRHYWLRQIIKADSSAGAERSDRTRYLAATASLELASPLREAFSNVRLTVPLKKSLGRKKKLMQQSIDAYRKAARYQVEEVTTAATFNLAEIYRQFAKALLESERPRGLDEEELEEYTYLLEDQAFPFEEKAIGIHESNVARIPGGSYDDSIRNSLASLAAMMPFRYAKNEVSEAHDE